MIKSRVLRDCYHSNFPCKLFGLIDPFLESRALPSFSAHLLSRHHNYFRHFHSRCSADLLSCDCCPLQTLRVFSPELIQKWEILSLRVMCVAHKKLHDLHLPFLRFISVSIISVFSLKKLKLEIIFK